jgi:hypothetical protein
MCEEGYKNLFAAIFKQAVIDTNFDIKKAIDEELKSMGYGKKTINDFLSEQSNAIFEIAQKTAYKDGMRWPNTNKGDYSKTISQIRNKFIKIFFAKGNTVQNDTKCSIS